ncbi:MAG: acetyl-CoA carboxylase biotin carboxylase subunit [Proteobacteria bacterium]|nr:acetyl-CoA carboxylase biotin carboxylase subunit [Pseudomonadota bacterium]
MRRDGGWANRRTADRPKQPINRILVANRGEIAVRIIRTCRDRNIETVAVYSDADRTAPHVLMADWALPIGPAPARESYLDIDKLLAACRRSGADAVHPGYGFLSENPAFADACAASGIGFIGPPSQSMRVMGEKTRAREAMMAADVPVVPGDNGRDGKGFPDADSALAAARRIGFPVLIKASAGGGGKGMRLVDQGDDFAAAFAGARREAEGAFGDGTLYLEKAIVRPRHVEIQVFADAHGNVVHLGERDCSIQRRHQKVIEEAPSPVVTGDLRRQMGESAVGAARACNYVGAGTVEFLLAQDGSYYFLEMNTRLQVEHPVTEVLYGVDLVAWQIDIAEGKTLPLGQAELDEKRRGAAIECRIYAEDSERFLPSPGTIVHLRVPSGPYVRDDSGVYEGSEISTHYDPMISKLIVWGEDRSQALGRMRRALDEYAVHGIRTNIPFHRRILRNRLFCDGVYDTGFVDRTIQPRATLSPARPGGEKDRAQSATGGAQSAGEDDTGDLDRERRADLEIGLVAAAIADASRTTSRAIAPSSGDPPNPDNNAISVWRTGLRGWRSR